MVYATWQDELQAFEADCDRLRKARRESFPVKVLGLAPLAAIPFMGSLPAGRKLLAFVGMAVSGISLLLEMDRQREVYGGNLAIDLNPNSDYDNLAGAFRTRSPRWEALAYLYSQLDPVNLKDKLGQLEDTPAKRCLDRMLRRVQAGLSEIRALNPNKPAYADIVMDITAEWRGDVIRILDRALFSAGAAALEDTDLSVDEVLPAGTGSTGNTHAAIPAAIPPLFNWADLAARPDFYPHLLLLGKTGAGKTHLAERLLNLLPGDRLVISPHVRPQEFPGVPKVGMGRDYRAISEALAELESEMQQRYEQYAKGVNTGRWLNVVVDEYPAIAAYCKNATGVIQVLAREARKVRIRLLILSQGAEVKTLGIEGQGSLRECFTFIRGRGFVEDYARRLKNEANEAIARWLQQQPFPWMVEDQPADTSTLASVASVASVAAVEPVEPLGNKGSTGSTGFDIEPEDPEDKGEAVLEPEMPMLPGIMLTPEATRLLVWLTRKAEQGKTLHTLRELQQGKPLGKGLPHTVEAVQPVISELLGAGLVVWANGAIVLNGFVES
ncbi:ATP-binding protein [Thermoleptolyngbya oregonensis NK1-22]|uniref:ATP-binding protein n=1 Tax=Thermoleptolyngbya oregonensis NK1-22 TaxID=2547457 RepID=A0AA96YD37_9CYAN|nr:hypothetical protein [Thermoleptolyngbya oregonensis]WOB45488.1 ATP-binding protein [Thermoleptolyngbya oregonensis NK1-22]